MAGRLAQAGYIVLAPDIFYRFGPYGLFDARDVLRGDAMAVLGPLMATTSNAKAAEDTAALLDYLDTRGDAGDPVGAVGLCSGGGMAIAAAGAHPERIAAAASFHGGNLATDAADSPHRYAPRLRAELSIAAAGVDDSFPPAMAARLEEGLRAAGVR
jgi:carboxymethylenebutenolidase